MQHPSSGDEYALTRVCAAAGAPSRLIGISACVAAPAAQPTAAPRPSQYLAPLATDKHVSITFENYNLATAGIGRDATLKMHQEFGEQHPNLTVETKATSSDNMFPSIQAEVAAGDPPDLAQLVLREWDLNVENLPVKSLTDLISPDELQAHIGGTYPIHPKAVQLTVGNGKMQGLPYVFSTPTLFYNADLFTAAGLDPDNPPETWADVEAAGMQIKDRTGNPGLYIACIENDWCAQAVLLSNGARIMSEDRTRIMFGEPPAIEVFRFWQKLVQEGVHARLSDAEGLLKSASGKWQLRATGMPVFENKPVVPTNSGSGLAILSSDPDKQRAARGDVRKLRRRVARNPDCAHAGQHRADVDARHGCADGDQPAGGLCVCRLAVPWQSHPVSSVQPRLRAGLPPNSIRHVLLVGLENESFAATLTRP